MLDFLKQYIRHPSKIGAIAPSSVYLAKSMLRMVDFKHCSCIIEYGPGTGVFTKEIIKRKKKETIFLVIEDNLEFYNKLVLEYGSVPGVQIIHGKAENVKEYMIKFKVKTIDYIISGLPFTSLPKEISTSILLKTHEIMNINSKFIAFQYTLMKQGVFKTYFKIMDCKREYRNLPPAYVLVMDKRNDIY